MLKIAVLLASYNGSKFIEEQVNSILRQNITSFEVECDLSVFISDDSSTDDTQNIVNRLSTEHHNVILLDGSRKGGVQSNFNFLVKNVDADYYFFSDQDDFWLPYKLSIFFHSLRDVEGPCLAYSDVCVVDEFLFPISASMMNMQKLKKTEKFSDFLIQNSVTGCACGFNKHAAFLLRQCNLEYSTMHDWYAALIISICGRIKYIPYSTVLYRQHGSNQVGAMNYRDIKIFRAMKEFRVLLERANKSLCANISQTALLLDDLSRLDSIFIDPKELSFADEYYKSFQGSFLDRLKCYLKSKKLGALRCFLYFYVYVIRGKSIYLKSRGN